MSATRKLAAWVGVAAVALLTSACDGIIGITNITAADGSAEDATEPEAGPDQTSPIDSSPPPDTSVADTGHGADTGTVADTGIADAPSSNDVAVEAACPGQACSSGCLGDVHNCGACGTDCEALPHVTGTATCNAGTCNVPTTSCAAGWTYCSGDGSAGCTTSLASNPNCGTCGMTCPASAPNCSPSGTSYGCTNGCAAGQMLCGTSCTNTSNDAQNCGMCGMMCSTSVSHATPTCVNSQCGGFTCVAPYSACNGGCANFANDNSNCGACGTPCTTSVPHQNANCANSMCSLTCAGGYNSCNGGCVDYTSDNNNCGSCNNPCSTGTTCSASHCVCNTSSGCNGCCSGGNTCEAYSGQGPATCGAGGANCAACPAIGETCASVANGGQCQCPNGESNCNGTCVNVMGSDASNCGSCGHSCIGGICAAGVCKPGTLAPTAGTGCGVVSLTTDGSTIYWTDLCNTAGEVFSCSGTGCNNAPTMLYQGLPAGQITALGGSLYWESAKHGYPSTVQACTPSGCGTPTALGQLVTGGFAIGGSDLLWWDGASSIYSCALGSCANPAGGVYLAATSGTGGPQTIAANGSNVFWTDTGTGSIRGCALSSGACGSAFNVASSSGPNLIIADSSNVYWSDNNNVWQCPASSACTSPIALAAGLQSADSLASDGTYVYWTNGGVVRAQIGVANSASGIPGSTGGASNVVATSAGVYWSVGGAIMVLAK